MRVVITTTLNDNLFHAKLVPLVQSREDLEVVVVSDRQGPQYERIKWVWPTGIWSKLGRLGGRLPLLLKEVFNPRTQLVMAYSVVPHGLFAVVLAKIRGVPVYLHFIAGPAEIKFAHNVDVSDNRVIERSKHPERLEKIARYFSQKAERIFVPGSNTERFLTAQGYRADQIIKLHSTIDPSRYYPGENERDIDILIAAQLRERKRPIFTLEVFREILNRRPQTKLCWLGDGGMHDEFAAALERLHLREAVLWTQTNQVADYYRRSRVFLLCSINEGLSLASMEAMRCGMVAITTDCGDMSDTIRTGQTGHLLPIEASKEQFVEAALNYLNNPDEWGRQSQNAFELIDKEHSFPSAISAWQNILKPFV
ncbi:glycosyltransferase [bacterium]|nr:glycosyltransferase [bacterium]MBU1920987.1 glycosyltransferase [bacterium]